MLSDSISADPSPLLQTAVYMTGVLAGWCLMTPAEEWGEVRRAVRRWWRRPS